MHLKNNAPSDRQRHCARTSGIRDSPATEIAFHLSLAAIRNLVLDSARNICFYALILLTEGVFRRRLGDGAGCGARAQVSHTWTREAFGTPLGRHYERPARSWLTSGRDQKWSDEKRGPRTEIAAVERREARRSWTGDLRRNGDRPDREAGHAVRRSAPAPSRRSAPLASLQGEVAKARGASALARIRWAV